MRLARVGLDNVIGYIPDLYNLLALSTTNTLQSSRITCFETKSLLEKYSNLQIVDVRNKSEISDSGSIDNSIPIPLSQLHNSLHKLHTENQSLSTAQTSIASSWLRHKGFLMSQNSSEAFRHGNFARPLPRLSAYQPTQTTTNLVTSVVYDLSEGTF